MNLVIAKNFVGVRFDLLVAPQISLVQKAVLHKYLKRLDYIDNYLFVHKYDIGKY